MFYFLKWLIGSVTGGLPLSALPFSFESKPASPGVIRTLSQVPDGETVYCDTDDVVKILSDGGVVARAGSASTMTNPVENSWPIFRHAGKIYLKAYTLPTSVDKIGSSAVDLFNDNNSGDLRGVSDDSVTVPLAGADLVDSTRHDKWSELTVDNIKTDSLTQDKHE
jgi:hypothetical protein